MSTQQIKILKRKFKDFLNDQRWDLHPTMQRFTLKGFRSPEDRNAICLCLSHSVICFRLAEQAGGKTSKHVIYCGLTKYQTQDCADGVRWEKETHTPACDRLELYTQDEINFLPIEPTPFQAAIDLVDKIHAHFDIMSVDSTSIDL